MIQHNYLEIHMERPKPMSSTIVETENELTVTTPKKKSWVAIILLSILTLQFSFGLFSTLFLNGPTAVGRIIMPVFSLMVLYFLVKGLLWQLKGKTILIISSNTLTVINKSLVSTKNKVYRLSDVGLVGVKNDALSEGPLAMLAGSGHGYFPVRQPEDCCCFQGRG